MLLEPTYPIIQIGMLGLLDSVRSVQNGLVVIQEDLRQMA